MDKGEAHVIRLRSPQQPEHSGKEKGGYVYMLSNSMEKWEGKDGSMWERPNRMRMNGIESLEGCKQGSPNYIQGLHP